MPDGSEPCLCGVELIGDHGLTVGLGDPDGIRIDLVEIPAGHPPP